GVNTPASTAGESALKYLQIAYARRIARGRNAGRNVGQRTLGITHLERVEFRSQKPRPARPLSGEDRDMPRDVRAANGQLVAADRADRGMFDGRVGSIACLHQIRAALVVALFAHHRPDESDRAHLVGKLLEALGYLNPLDGGGDCLGSGGDSSVGVRIKGL